MGKYQVAVVKDKDIRVQVGKALELLGGMERFVKPGQKVLMKPNLTGPASYEKGVTTNPFLPEALTELAWEAGASAVDVGDGRGSLHIGTYEVMKQSDANRVHSGKTVGKGGKVHKKPDGILIWNQLIQTKQTFGEVGFSQEG